MITLLHSPLFLFFYYFVRILYPSMVNGFQAIDENLFGNSYVIEGYLALTEHAVLHLLINELVDKLGDALLGIFLHRVGCGLACISHH